MIQPHVCSLYMPTVSRFATVVLSICGLKSLCTVANLHITLALKNISTMILQGEPPQRGTTEASDNGSKRQREAAPQRAAASGEGGAPAAPKTTAAGSKVPRWLKVGK